MSDQSSSSVQVLPFSISFNGRAPIDTYFQVVENEPNIAHFRGRKLIAKEINLPPHIKAGHMVISTNDKGSERKAEISKTFDKVTVWGHGARPSGQEFDNYTGLIDLCNAINSD